ncbi:MAG: PD-(D/E)XK nuclease domain-containing protein, partial [Clostridiales bacterium]|nr:PD-(D/E)XK nuclease domain-containing protein [Clostridiales bacterium]
WYDGYRFPGAETIYSPKSVVEAITRKRCSDYWNQTETYEALRIYVDMNFDGLKDTVIELLAGGRNQIDARTFTNDMTTFESRDDVLTLLIHLGYLGYDADTREVFIPNKEIADEFVSAVKGAGWDEAARTVRESEELLQAAWRQDARAVAEYLEKAHGDVSHLVYNDENALSYAVSLAFYTARQYYEVVREMPAGKGFADLLFRPRKKYPDKPAMIVELKWNRSAVTAIRQIEDRDYAEALKGFAGEVLLIGINYSKKTKKHTCVIKKLATP